MKTNKPYTVHFHFQGQGRKRVAVSSIDEAKRVVNDALAKLPTGPYTQIGFILVMDKRKNIVAILS